MIFNRGTWLFFIVAAAVNVAGSRIVADVTNGFGCFHCQSLNRSNPICEDPFNATRAYEAGYYQSSCMTGMKERNGLYPGSACLKIKGTYKIDSRTVTVRTCVVDSGTMTSDTELIRNEHSCGQIIYGNANATTDAEELLKNKEQYKLYACIDVCSTSQGCNKSSPVMEANQVLILWCWIILFRVMTITQS